MLMIQKNQAVKEVDNVRNSHYLQRYIQESGGFVPDSRSQGVKNSPGGKVEKHLDFLVGGFCRNYHHLRMEVQWVNNGSSEPSMMEVPKHQ